MKKTYIKLDGKVFDLKDFEAHRLIRAINGLLDREKALHALEPQVGRLELAFATTAKRLVATKQACWRNGRLIAMPTDTKTDEKEK